MSATNGLDKAGFGSATFFYDGTKKYEQVEAFLFAAKNFKTVNKISDTDAILTLPHILKGEAVNWWDGIKASVSTWNMFETQLRLAFAPVKPGYIIFQELYEMRQLPNERIKNFVNKQRALLNQLSSPGFTEVQQLDFIYGFLNSKTQNLIPRESFSSFDTFFKLAKEVEQKEKSLKTPENRVEKKKRVRCNFCRLFGHMANVCRKLKASQEQAIIPSVVKSDTVIVQPATSTPSSSQPTTSTPSSPQPTTSTPSTPSSPPGESNKENSNTSRCTFDPRPRPMVEIGIGATKELAFIDSGAITSLASYELYTYLKNIGFHFQEENKTMTFADGIKRHEKVLTVRVPVKLCDRCILTSFMILPEARGAKTLLGVDFLQEALMVLNLPQLTWHFIDAPDVHYDLIQEDC